MELHGTVGPANTTLTEVAKLAGVSRMTVYNHFPTEVDLFTACSTHWASQNPFPDPSGWTGIADPSQRLVDALKELYGWYGLKQRMLGNVLRDVSIVPALAEVMDDLWSTYLERAVQALASGWSLGNVEADELHAMLRLAVDFNTWRVLTGSGLDHPVVAEVVAHMVIGTASSR